MRLIRDNDFIIYYKRYSYREKKSKKKILENIKILLILENYLKK